MRLSQVFGCTQSFQTFIFFNFLIFRLLLCARTRTARRLCYVSEKALYAKRAGRRKNFIYLIRHSLFTFLSLSLSPLHAPLCFDEQNLRLMMTLTIFLLPTKQLAFSSCRHFAPTCAHSTLSFFFLFINFLLHLPSSPLSLMKRVFSFSALNAHSRSNCSRNCRLYQWRCVCKFETCVPL